MPTQYYCSQCHLGFETGWFHYDRESNNAMAATLLACTRCGAAYMLDHKRDDSRDELYAFGGPVTWIPTEHEGLFRYAPGTPKKGPIDCNHDFRQVRKKPEMARLEGVLDELDLSDFACVFCHARGALVSQWPKNQTICPRCGKDSLQPAGSYIT